MNSDRFDDLLRVNANSTTRRGAIAALTAGLLAGLPVALGLDEIAAKQKSKGKKANNKKNNKRKKAKKRRAGEQPASPPPPPPPGPIDRADATCPGPNNSGFGTNGEARLAQTFSALASGPLVRAEVDIAKADGASGDLILRLAPLNGDGRPTNDVLAESAVANASLPDEESTVSFTFSQPFSVVAGTAYALVLTQSEASQLEWVGHNGNTCGGGAFLSLSQTAAFVNLGESLDLIFTTFVNS